jgi:aryl-phospho-beta-D-glucosidase BglC (GH1 family)
MLHNRLKGVNLGGWFSQIDAIKEKDPQKFPGTLQHIVDFLNVNDFKRIQKSGFNHVRLPVDYSTLFDENSLQPKKEYFELLDKAIQNILAENLVVILDLHKCPGHDFHSGTSKEQSFFTDSKEREKTKKIWAYMAERYCDDSRVWMELLNEPTAQDSKLWDQYKDELFWEIRKHAPKNPIVVGSNRWNSASEFANLTPIDDDNVLYSFHFYTPIGFTHQNAAWLKDPFFQQKRDWPGDYPPPNDQEGLRLNHEYGVWNKTRLKSSIQNALDFREKYKVPVACNEFGVYVQTKREHQLSWLQDFLSLLKEADVGFSYWNYKNLDFGIVSKGESLHQNLSQYQNPEGLDQELLNLLANS